ncbi:MAG: hypothetical protein ACR2JB_20845 [Bryobacteraceae bacterium]
MAAQTAKPPWVEFDKDPFPPAYRDESGNAQGRIEESGPGSEILRRVAVQLLRSHMEAFYETASTVDVLALLQVFELQDHGFELGPLRTPGQSTFIEAFLAMLGLDPEFILRHNIQRMPIR